MKSLVIGLGETGQPLYEILSKAYDVGRVDPAKGLASPTGNIDVMNVCLPYSERFVEIVIDYQNTYKAELIINHSTVPVGTTAKLPKAVHSPILGDHTNMEESLKQFTKWIGGARAENAEAYLGFAGIHCRAVARSEETEILKLMCLAKYGMSIAFAQYQKDVFDDYGFDYSHILEWDMNYNMNVRAYQQRPLIKPPGKCIEGHCVVPGSRLLFIDHPNPIVAEVMKFS